MEKLSRKCSRYSRTPRSQNAAANASTGSAKSAGHVDITRHPLGLLLGIARQSGTGDSDSCRIILSILSASRAVRRALGRELDQGLGFQDHSGSRCVTLLTLYALDPLPATAADLAYHAEVSRASMTDIIKTLEQHRMITREAAGRDRSRPIYLTEPGRQAAVFAVHRFLQLASNLAGDVGSPTGNATIETCEQVECRAAFPGV